MKYEFPNLNSGANITNPKLKVGKISYEEGVASVDVLISVGNAPAGQAPNFVINLTGFIYTGDEPLKADIDIWVASELIKYEV